MLERVQGLPDHVLGFSAKGKITASDYEDTLVPAIEAALAQGGKLRLFYEMGADFEGIEMGAVWDDAKVGVRHPAAWERVALVSDVEWIRVVGKAFGFAMPGHVRVFSNEEVDAARSWIAE